MRRFAKTLILLIALAILLPLAAFALLHTGPGEALLARVLSGVLSTPERSVSLVNPRLDWGGIAHIERVSVGDADGGWLMVEGIEVRWQPLALLAGRVEVDRLSVASTTLTRPPKPGAEAEEAEPASLFALPLSIDIADIRLAEVALDAPVAGTPVRLFAEGSFALHARPAVLEAALRVARDDDVAGRLDAQATFRPDDEVLRFRLQASEPRGGLIARLLDLGELPAVEVRVDGDGPLSDWKADLSVALDGIETVSGAATLTALKSPLPGHVRDLRFALDGALERLAPRGLKPLFAGSTAARGDIALDADFMPRSGTVDAETGAFALNARLSRTQGDLSGTLAAALRQPVTLAFGDRTVAAERLTLDAEISGTIDKADWRATLEGAGLATAEGRMTSLRLSASGREAILAPDRRHVPARIDLTGEIAQAADPRLAGFTGPLTAQAALVLGPGITLEVTEIQADGPGLALAGAARYAPDAATATGTLEISDLAGLSALAGRPLGGAATVAFEAEADPSARSGSISLQAEGADIALGIPRLDDLLRGPSTLSGRLSRSPEGRLAVADAALRAQAISLALAGESDLETVDARLSAQVSDLARVDPSLGGGLTLKADASGPLDAPRLAVEASGEGIVARGERIENLAVSGDITASTRSPAGTIRLDARFRDQPLTASAALSSNEAGVRRIDNISVVAGASRLSGQLAFAADDTPSGSLDLSSPDLAEIAPLLLQQVAGALSAHAEIGQENGRTVARITARAAELQRDGVRVSEADLAATIADPFTAPSVGGTLQARGVRAGETLVESLRVEASGTQAGTEFSVRADLADGALALTGAAENGADGITVRLAEADGTLRGVKTRLAAPATIRIDEAGTTHVDDARLALGGGGATISGTAGKTLDLAIALETVPASLAEAVSPGLGLAGTIGGKVTVAGPASNPQAAWTLTWNGAEANALAALGLPAATVKSEGRYEGGAIRHTTLVGVGERGTLTAKGSLALAGSPTLDMRVSGTLPFDLARRQLTRSSLRLDGSATVDLSVTGGLAAPAINGTLSTRDATAVSLNTGLVLKGIAADASVTAGEVRITSFNGSIGGGGSVSGSGTIGLLGAMPAELSLKIRDGAYSDGRIVNARLNADLALKGPLAGVPTITGTVDVLRADITIPQALPTTLAPVAVEHVNAPGDVARQAAALRQGPREASATGANLDVSVRAPGQIFVRGRGLQAELGGQIRILGTTANPVTSGAFTLRHGTLTLLSRLLTFTKGTISFLGTFDPLLDFAASTTASGTTITVSVTGNASDPKVAFSSSPDLPQEEILALLLFDRSLSSLSAAQVAQLAGAVAALGGADPLDKLRKSLGVDAINITTGEDNSATIELRKRVGDKVYLGVQQGSQEGSSRVTVDIDVTKSIRARGETDASGSSKAGIYFEREY